MGISSVVVVVGLGYIGLPTAAILASNDVKVVGVDVNPNTVAAVNRGDVPFVEPDLATYVAGAVQQGTLRATAAPMPADASSSLCRRRSRVPTNPTFPTSSLRLVHSPPALRAVNSSSWSPRHRPEPPPRWRTGSWKSDLISASTVRAAALRFTLRTAPSASFLAA